MLYRLSFGGTAVAGVATVLMNLLSSRADIGVRTLRVEFIVLTVVSLMLFVLNVWVIFVGRREKKIAAGLCAILCIVLALINYVGQWFGS